MHEKVSQWQVLINLTRRDFKTRYLGSIMGSYWNLIHPLMMILIYTLVFSKVMRARLGVDGSPFSYSLYLCSALIAWNLFSEVVNRGTVTLVDNGEFIKKLSFRPILLFQSMAASSLVNFSIAFGIFMLFLLWINPPNFGLFITYLFTVVLFASFALGCAVALGCLNVLIRDFQQMTSVIFQLWFWFTPIVYSKEALPELALNLLRFNPAFPFVDAMHDLLYFQKWPTLWHWSMMVFWVAVSGILGVLIYRRSIDLVRDQL